MAASVFSLARLGLHCPGWFEAVSLAAQEDGLLKTFSPAALATLPYAFQSLQIKDVALLHSVSKEVRSRDLASFAPQDLSALLLSFANLEVQDAPLFVAVAREVIEGRPALLPDFDPAALSNLVYVVAIAVLISPDVFTRLPATRRFIFDIVIIAFFR
jgi:hypothetical protein